MTEVWGGTVHIPVQWSSPISTTLREKTVKNISGTIFSFSRAAIILIALFGLGIAPGITNAQTFRGTILGSVIDKSGASVGGASVTVRNVGHRP